jgi:hypothetical protein
MMAVLAGKLEARREDRAPVAGKSTLNRLELICLEPTRCHKVSHDPIAIKRLMVRRLLPVTGPQSGRPWRVLWANGNRVVWHPSSHGGDRGRPRGRRLRAGMAGGGGEIGAMAGAQAGIVSAHLVVIWRAFPFRRPKKTKGSRKDISVGGPQPNSAPVGSHWPTVMTTVL